MTKITFIDDGEHVSVEFEGRGGDLTEAVCKIANHVRKELGESIENYQTVLAGGMMFDDLKSTLQKMIENKELDEKELEKLAERLQEHLK